MQHSSTQDTLVGLFVASGIIGLFFLAMQISNLSSFISDDGYTVNARFQNSGGLKIKSPVSVAGVKIGQVSAIHLGDDYRAIVTIKIKNQYNKLPSDTSASIFTAGLLGEQYINLEPGGMDDYLHDNSEIDITQSAIILEQALGQFLFKKSADK
ncbi:MAG: outer membrane lipid asymmetry maintenance protein MlaD [Methylococcales bacterium]|nr:outer membrane lipid asymmetry maintenance protein MlaD [Methylococcales bacterium]